MTSEITFWDEASEGMEVPSVEFPITVHRLVVAAGANRDFASVHHNADAARATGAPDLFANNVFIQGMLERTARSFFGPSAVIRKIGPFRMHAFLVAGQTATVSGKVDRMWVADDGAALLDLSLICSTPDAVTASGSITAMLPRTCETSTADAAGPA